MSIEMPKFHCRVAKQRPPGTISLSRFAEMHCVTKMMLMRHIVTGIAGERIEVTETTLRKHVHRYLTPKQQRKALDFWDRYGVWHQ